jgi:ribosomal protein L28
MARVCDITGRKTSFGHKMKHRRGSSGGGGAWAFRSHKSLRTWLPNLRKIRVNINGQVETIRVSMKAYKALRKNGSVNGITLAK